MSKEEAGFPQVVGINVKKIRGQNTLEDVALAGQNYGASWSSGSISAIEQGRFKATLDTLALLSLALTDLRQDNGEEVTISELLETEQPIQISETNESTYQEVLTWLAGKPLRTNLNARTYETISARARAEVERVKGLHFPPNWVIDTGRGGPLTTGEKRLAKRAGIDPHELRAWSLHLWGKTLEDRRDEIAGPSSSPQKKGRVSRELLDEIEAAMKGRSRGDD